MKRVLALPRMLALGLIRGYQLAISPMLGPRCRFYPTCSHYTADAIRGHGFLSGLWLGVKRIVKCHPFHPGGFDPVPPAPETCGALTGAEETPR